MKETFLYALVLVSLLFGNCSNDDTTPFVDPSENEVDTTGTVDPIDPTGEENYLSGNSDYIFDQSKLHSFDLTLSQEDYDKINNDPAAEEYVGGSLTFEGETIAPVGIRYKGSIGAFVNCLSGSNWGNPSGYKTCTKLSMKIKINWEGSDEKFYGLKKLQFHSMNNDPTQMRDRLAYHLFSEMGIPSPRAVHARLTINGEYVGLFILVEQIDNRFAKYHFDDGDGNIYKEVWPIDDKGEVQPDDAFRAALKTNEDDPQDFDLIRGFASDISLSTVQNRKTVVEKWMNVDEIISYAVVDRTIRADDGPFHWYCDFGSCDNHNYYWYEDPIEEKFHLIPWDFDHAFENIISNVNPVVPIKDGWGEITNNCQPFPYGFLFVSQKSAACDKLTAAWVAFDALYDTKRSEFISGPFSKANTDLLLNAWTSQIESATSSASAAHDDAISTLQWQNALSDLREQLDFARL